MKVLDGRTTSLQVFESLESEVRSYCRSFPTVFTKAQGYKLWDADNRVYRFLRRSRRAQLRA